MKFQDLFSIIKNRRNERPENSYTSSLFKQGEDRIVQKVGEEAVELIIAAKGKSQQRIIEEMADLYFMSLVLLAYKNIELNEVINELERRKKKNG